MKKTLLLILFPCLLFAQENLIDLKPYGLTAHIASSEELPIDRIEQEESYLKTIEIKIYYQLNEKITITQLKKPITLAVTKSQFDKVLKQKHDGITLKALVKTGNDILMERTYKEDGRKIYKFILLRVIQGKEYMIESSDMDDEAQCRSLMNLAKTCK